MVYYLIKSDLRYHASKTKIREKSCGDSMDGKQDFWVSKK